MAGLLLCVFLFIGIAQILAAMKISTDVYLKSSVSCIKPGD